ncbi:MAG: sugar phosphate nucleotidyltransferase, partial [Planctomycetota bacterium]
PIVDASGRPVRIATVDALIAAAVPHAGEAPASTDGVHARRAGRDAPTTAVIMAGGKGTRLRPLTQHTPKPMLDVAGRPLLEHTIERLRGAGIDRICISTNYLADLIIDHFGNGAGLGVSISYLREDAPLGTAGCLGLLDPIPGGPVLVLNGDILTSVDFDAMRRFHDDNAAGLTVAVRNHKISVPFGVAECEGVAIRSLVEKPTYSVLVNAGIYLIEPALLRAIPRGASGPARFDMTELIDAARSPGAGFTAGPVCAFAVREYWLDIGQPGDYERAQREGPEVVVRPSLDQHRAAG